MIHVAALVINWNGADDTLDLVESLIEEVEPSLQIEIVVVDNASQPQDLAILKTGLERMGKCIPIAFIANDTNVGVPAAYNQAIATVHNRDCLFLRLDNDVVFLRGGVRALCDGLRDSRDTGVRIVGGNIRYYDKPEVHNGGACFFGLIKGSNRIVYPPQNTQCDGVLGCVMLIDPEVVRAFEPEVFLAWLFFTTDESEFSVRCRSHGWMTLYLSRSIALHKGGRSTRKIGSRSSYLSLRNWSYLALRYVQPRVAIVLVVGRIAVTVIYKLLRGDIAAAKAMLVGSLAATRDQRQTSMSRQGT